MSLERFFDEDLYRRAEAATAEFLEHRWNAYVAAVDRLEGHPENRDGADKTWVLRALGNWHEFFERVEPRG